MFNPRISCCSKGQSTGMSNLIIIAGILNVGMSRYLDVFFWEIIVNPSYLDKDLCLKLSIVTPETHTRKTKVIYIALNYAKLN